MVAPELEGGVVKAGWWTHHQDATATRACNGPTCPHASPSPVTSS